MKTNIDERFAVHVDDYKHYDTKKIRDSFLVQDLFNADAVRLCYSHYDRMIVGGAMPVAEQITLPAIDQLKADEFLDRREMGIINVGGKGTVVADGVSYDLDYKEALYLGRGSAGVKFSSAAAAAPAKFYINSTPAHAAYPTRKVGHDEAEVVEMGSLDRSNSRTIRKLIVNSVLETCQLQMGMTELDTGSVWNTMPPHTHSRRMEAYFYFEVPKDQAVSHFMGPAEETRHIWMNNEEAVLSPPWSMHCGAGTCNYTFIWGMAGENLDYGDMDHHSPGELK